MVLGAYGWSHAVGASACFVSGDRWESTVLPSMCSWSDGESDPSDVFSVWDSPIPMSVVSMASLESYPAERSEMWDRSGAAGIVYGEWGSRNPSWD